MVSIASLCTYMDNITKRFLGKVQRSFCCSTGPLRDLSAAYMHVVWFLTVGKGANSGFLCHQVI